VLQKFAEIFGEFFFASNPEKLAELFGELIAGIISRCLATGKLLQSQKM